MKHTNLFTLKTPCEELLHTCILLGRELKSYISLLEEGLEAALKATSALYDHTPESLMNLTAEDISNTFQGAKICDLLLQPGTTTLDLSLQAGCFTNESKYGIHDRRMKNYRIWKGLHVG